MTGDEEKNPPTESVLLNIDILSEEYDDETEEDETKDANEAAVEKSVSKTSAASPQPTDSLSLPQSLSISIDEERPKYETEKKKKEFMDFINRDPSSKRSETVETNEYQTNGKKRIKPPSDTCFRQSFGCDSLKKKGTGNENKNKTDAFGTKNDEKALTDIRKDSLQTKKRFRQELMRENEPKRKTDLSGEMKNRIEPERGNKSGMERNKRNEKRNLSIQTFYERKRKILEPIKKPVSFSVAEKNFSREDGGKKSKRKEPTTANHFDFSEFGSLHAKSVKPTQTDLNKKKRPENVYGIFDNSLMETPQKEAPRKKETDLMQIKSDRGMKTDMMR